MLTAFSLAGEGAHPRYSAYRSFNREFGTTRQFANLGVTTRGVFIANTRNSLGQPYCEYAPVWNGIGDYDWRALDDQIGDIVKASPTARFIVGIDLNTPEWLHRQLRLDSFDAIELAVCDPDWMKITEGYLADVLNHVERRYGDRVLAYTLMCGSTDEWYGRGGMGFRSVRQEERWRDWRKRNGMDPSVPLPPFSVSTNAMFGGTFYDPAKQRVNIDYVKFRDESVADAIIAFSRLAKRRIAEQKEVGVFYGYYYYCMNDHMDYERLFAAPEVDFVISPATYSYRGVGGGAGSLMTVDTLARHGKRFFHEIDLRPHDMSNPPYVACGSSGTSSDAEDVAVSLREACYALIAGGSWWWFDQWGGYYKTPAFLERIRAFEEVAARHRNDPITSRADVLYIADPESIRHSNLWMLHASWFRSPYGESGSWFPEEVRSVLNASGYVVDYCSWGDLAEKDLSRYKAVVFPLLFVITPEKESILRNRVCRDGRTVVFFGAVGVSDDKSIDVARVERFAGVPFGTKGVSTRKREGWTSVYLDWLPPREKAADAFRGILSAAKCHEWVGAAVPVEANERLLSVHTAEGGRLKVSLPKRFTKVVNAFSGRVVAENSDCFVENFKAPDTVLFELIER